MEENKFNVQHIDIEPIEDEVEENKYQWVWWVIALLITASLIFSFLII